MTAGERMPPLHTPAMWITAAVTFTIWLAHAVLARLVASRLPERFPVHFDFAGEPDRWAARGDTEWYVTVALGGVLALGLTAFGLAFHRMPLRFVNLPGKQRLLALPPERRPPVLRVAAWLLVLLGLLIATTFASIQYLMYRTALLGWVESSIFAVLGLEFAALVGLVAGATIAMRRRLRRALDGPR